MFRAPKHPGITILDQVFDEFKNLSYGNDNSHHMVVAWQIRMSSQDITESIDKLTKAVNSLKKVIESQKAGDA